MGIVFSSSDYENEHCAYLPIENMMCLHISTVISSGGLVDAV